LKSYQPLVDKYTRQATYYDRRWNLHWGEATLRATVDAVPWNELRRVLDVGCGTGSLEESARAKLAVSPDGKSASLHLIGVDIALPMLQLAREKLNGTSGSHPRIHWANSPAEHLPFASGSFDGLICNNSFHYYKSALPVLMEFHRVLHPGGTLILADWCRDFITPKVGYWLLRFAHHTHIHRYALSRVYGSQEMQSLVTKAGFQAAAVERIGMDWGWGIMLLRATA
jgi:ubiquinone/menaquinone biosynthesis C-methylase UbiE